MLSNGLGCLVDGFFGNSDSERGWVGFNMSRIELNVEFTEPRSFQGVVIHARNLAGTSDLLSYLQIEASNDGVEYTLAENLTNVFPEASGNELKINLNIAAARWMKSILFQKPGGSLLISEITYIQGTI